MFNKLTPWRRAALWQGWRWIWLSVVVAVGIVGCSLLPNFNDPSASIVLITYSEDSGYGSQDFGSGFVIEQGRGFCRILTSGHVLEHQGTVLAPNQVMVRPLGASVRPSSSLKRFAGVDLGEIEIPTDGQCPYPALPLGDSDLVKLGAELQVWGYVNDGTGWDVQVKSVNVESAKGTTNGYGFGYTGRTLPGMSGSPVLRWGRVVGVHGLYEEGLDVSRAVVINAFDPDGESLKGELNGEAPAEEAPAEEAPAEEAPADEAPAEGVPAVAGLSRFRAETVTVDSQGNIDRRQSIEPEYFTERINGVGIDMVAISGGTFWMGSPSGEEGSYDDEKPQHEVTVQPFFMGKTEVTQAQWRAVAQLPQINRSLNPDPSRFKGDNRPVEQVSWDDAQEFIVRLSKATGKAYQLPSEAVWEYAARAGTTTPFAFGATLSTEIANYNGNVTYGNGKKGVYRSETVDVGSFPPNGWGLYDMHGNVWEWNEDSWHNSYNGAPTDGTAWIDNSTEIKLLRGGSWIFNPRSCRSAVRLDYTRDNRDFFIGFRLALPRT